MQKCWIIFILVLVNAIGSEGDCVDGRGGWLPSDYKAYQHPAKPTRVEYMFRVRSINKVDDIEQLMDISIALNMKWNDPRYARATFDYLMFSSSESLPDSRLLRMRQFLGMSTAVCWKGFGDPIHFCSTTDFQRSQRPMIRHSH